MKNYADARSLFLLLLTCFAWLLVNPTSSLAEGSFRTWRDKSGKFEVEAKLVEQKDGKARLLKKDGRIISVPVTALSNNDQKHLKSLANPANPFSGGELPKQPAPAASGSATPSQGAGLELLQGGANAKTLSADGQSVFLKVDRPMEPLPADASAASPEFRPFIVPLEKLDAYARCSSPIVISLEGPTYAVSTHRNGNAVSPATFGRIYLVQATQRRPQVALDIDQTLLLLDHHIPSGRSLAVLGLSGPSDRGGDLVLLDKLAAGQPAALARWRVPGWDKPGFKPKVEFARLLDGERALVKINSNVFVWNLLSGKSEFKIEGVRAGAKIALSGSGKYLAVPDTKGCRLIDVAKGELVGKIPFPSTLTPAVHFSPDGKQLAMFAGNQYVIWDFPQANVAAEGLISKPCGAFYGWVGNKRLLTQLGGLVDLEMGMSLWSYGLPTNNQALTLASGVVAVDKNNFATVMCLPVPHGPVEKVAKRLTANNSDLLAIRPGDAVSIVVEAGDDVDKAEIRQALQAAVERAGWKVSQKSPIQVVVKIERGKKQELHFRTLGRGFSRQPETVKIKPFTVSIDVRRGQEVLWKRSNTNMIPMIVHMEKGQTLKKALKKYEKADASYFKTIMFPPKVLRPEVGKNIGRSRIVEGAWTDFFPKS